MSRLCFLACLVSLLGSLAACDGDIVLGSRDSQGSSGTPDSGGRFVAFSLRTTGAASSTPESQIHVSDDGRTWRPTARFDTALYCMTRMTGANGTLLAIDAMGRSHLSRDRGETWREGGAAIEASKGTFVSVAHDATSGFLAVGGGRDQGGMAALSSDGVVWTPLPSMKDHSFRGVMRTPGGFRVTATLASDLMSPAIYALDAGKWRWVDAKLGSGFSTEGVQDSVYVEEWQKTFALRNHSVLETSNGEQWVEHPFGEPTGSWMRGITYGAGRLVVVGENGTTATSLDGITWTRGTMGWTRMWFDAVTYGAGVFVTVSGLDGAGSAFVSISTDGETWTDASPRDGVMLRQVVFAE